MLVAGEILNIFLLFGISNKNIFFIKKKKNVVNNSNIYDEFDLKILTYNVKNKHYTHTNLLKTNTIDFKLRG